MHYDHISFHLADLPADTPPQNAAHHIGYYFAWAVSQGLHSGAAAALPNFGLLRQGKISGATFVLTQLGGGIDSSCFNDLGKRFTEYYYADEEEGYGHFIRDYFHTLDLNGEHAFYQTADSPEHQQKLNRVFQAAFQKWRNSLTLQR